MRNDNDDMFSPLPGLAFRAKLTVQLGPRFGLPRAAHEQRTMLAREIAETMVRDQKFFRVTERPGGLLAEVRADCRVLTDDELREALARAYEAGARLVTPLPVLRAEG